MFGIAIVALVLGGGAVFTARATAPSGLVNIPIARGTKGQDGIVTNALAVLHFREA
jgi:hypothetical protein